MDRATQIEILQRINRFYDDGATTLADDEMYHRATTYNDPAYLAREREVLRKFPVIIGHSDAVPNAGDFFTDNNLGLPILVSRQPDGSLRAFLNVCRHRGSPVCNEASGNRRTFVCPYHAWSYRADGTLLQAPKNAFPGFVRGGHGLVQLPVQERHGFIWVVATPDTSIDVATHLDSYDAELASYGISDYVCERSDVLTVDLNWKYILDGFLEVYHIPTLHAKSIAPYIHGTYSLFDTRGLNSRLIVPRKAFDSDRHKPLEELDLLKNLACNYQLFPNSILVWQGDHFELWTSYPTNRPDQCTVRIMSLTTKEQAKEQHKARWDRNWKILIDTVVHEDWALSKRIQDAVPYVADNQIVFGRNEPGLQHFHGKLAHEVESLRGAA